MSFLQRLMGKSDTIYSAEEAKMRLVSAIAQDRLEVSPEFLDKIKQSLIVALSTHMSVDNEHVQMSVVRDGQAHCVVASIPIVNSGRLYTDSPRVATELHQIRETRGRRKKQSK